MAALCVVSVVGIPAAAVFLYRWLAAKTETVNGNRFTFQGSFGKAYALFGTQLVLDILLVLLVPLVAPHVGLVSRAGIFGFVLLSRLVVDLTIAYLLLGYFVTNMVDAGGRRLAFVGDGFGYVGFMLLILVSCFTIVGWAWAQGAYSRWICRNIRAEGVRVHFRASGWSILWRTFVYALCCIPIVTLPWASTWLYRFFIASVEIEHSPPAAA